MWMLGWWRFCERVMCFRSTLLLLFRRLRSPCIRTLPSPSSGEPWRQKFRLFCRRVQWSLRLSPGFYSRIFLVTKASGGWRPIIDLSTLNHFIVKTQFWMETTQSVLHSIHRNDCMVSVALKDVYLQVPIHPSSRKFLRFVAGSKAWQFRVRCLGLTTVLQVFTRVMAPVSAFLHQMGVRILRYLVDWLIFASCHEEPIWARDQVLDLCKT